MFGIVRPGNLAFICAGLALLAGCGGGDRPELGEVTGLVTLDGTPLAAVNILFTPDKGRPAGAVTDAEGRYELIYLNGVSGCKVGPCHVTFEWPPEAVNPRPIPAKYTGADGYTVDVKAGGNKFDFPMESK